MTQETLPNAIEMAVARARQLGAVAPIATTAAPVEEDGVTLQLLTVTPEGRSIRKPINRGRAEDHNPFLPYEEDLHVADLGADHVAILNKFPVTPGHLLIITRDFEEQTSLLTERDFMALAQAMSGVDGLVLFNGGSGAGASQRHKHLQLIPGQSAYIEPWLDLERSGNGIREAEGLGFRHAYHTLDGVGFEDPHTAGSRLFDAYGELLGHLGLSPENDTLPPYNLLATRRWLMAIPRTTTFWERDGMKIAVNAISFSGSMLVYYQELEPIIREVGMRRILAEVTR